MVYNYLIDPPAGPFSKPKEIRAWIKKLETEFPQDEESVISCLKSARDDLEVAESLESESN